MLDHLSSKCVLRALTAAILLSVPPSLNRASAAGADEWKPAAGPLMTRWAKDVSPDNVLPEYPRPQMVRRDWLNLNGLWDYAIRPAGSGGQGGSVKAEGLGDGSTDSSRGHRQAALDAATPIDPPFGDRPDKFDGKILVPFPVESALSGVMKPVGPDNRLWYRRTFTIPEKWNLARDKKRLLLHFGAVDWDATVWVNGNQVGSHKGGYDPFTFDITDAVETQDFASPHEIVVSVRDPTDAGTQPRGKQVRNPGSIWYTAVTGIWQTVWLEPVNSVYIKSVRMTPDVDTGVLRVRLQVGGEVSDPAKYNVNVTVVGNPPQRASATGGDRATGMALGGIYDELEVLIKEPKLWSPDQPHLYDVDIMVGKEASRTENKGKGRLTVNWAVVDHVRTYFAMRKISMAKDENGVLRLCLNNKPLFQYGPLDQGWWPDGLYTAPTDEALRYDIEVTKQLGMNMARKHVKVEPDRWYYWCDKLGLLLWQDMPSGDRYIGDKDPDIVRTEESARQFDTELTRIIEAFRNHPSIVMWVPFNEGWGQFDTPRVVDLVRKLDPTRLVNNASGWTDRGVGDVMDIHSYPGPAAPRVADVPSASAEGVPPSDRDEDAGRMPASREGKMPSTLARDTRAGVLGEFGGLGLPVSGHTWQAEKNWGYRSFKTADELTDAYLALIDNLRPLVAKGLSAAVYTQTTDVEIEVNGLMTYDRAIIKMDAAKVRGANEKLYLPAPTVKTVVPSAQEEPVEWRYTTAKPADDWFKPDFDAGTWKQGRSGFGTRGTPGAIVNTVWDTNDIWLRREFTLPEGQWDRLFLNVHHDEDVEVYINGVPAATATGYTSAYELLPIRTEAKAALKPGPHLLAIHCRQTGGGQYIDAGLVQVIEQK